MKKISIEISCKEIRWSGHSHKSCKVMHLAIESLNSSEFEIDNLTFARKSEMFLDSYGLNDTCFQGRFERRQVQYTNEPYIFQMTSSYDEADGFVNNIACSQAQIHIYFSYFDLLEQTYCTFVPLGTGDDCRSREYSELVEVEAMVQKMENNDFQVVNKTLQIEVLQDEKYNCTIIPSQRCKTRCAIFNNNLSKKKYHDTDLGIRLLPRDCFNLNLARTPSRCVGIYWNLHTWQLCSGLTFGTQVFHLDWRFDRWLLNNLTAFCRIYSVEMKDCLKNFTFCETPDLESFRFYTKLEKSYDDICANINDFSKGHNCFQSIMSNDEMKADYFYELQNCSSISPNDSCSVYSDAVLCSAFAQFKTFSNCSTIPATYRYKKLIENRNNAGGKCDTSEFDPCLTDDPKYDEVCSSVEEPQCDAFCSACHVTISSLVLMLFCLSIWMNLSK